MAAAGALAVGLLDGGGEGDAVADVRADQRLADGVVVEPRLDAAMAALSPLRSSPVSP